MGEDVTHGDPIPILLFPKEFVFIFPLLKLGISCISNLFSIDENWVQSITQARRNTDSSLD